MAISFHLQKCHHPTLPSSLSTYKAGQKTPRKINGWNLSGRSSSKAHHFQVPSVNVWGLYQSKASPPLHLISLCWEPLFILCTSLRLIQKNPTMQATNTKEKTGRILKFHEILVVFGGILISWFIKKFITIST